MDFFRKFKYNEYLRKNNLKSFFIKSPSQDTFLSNFIYNHFLIFFSNVSNFKNLVFSFKKEFLNEKTKFLKFETLEKNIKK